MEAQVAAILRGDLLEICVGTAFFVIGLISCGISVLRRRHSARVLLWIGLWSAAYGLLHLMGTRAVQLAVPLWLRAATPYVTTSVVYLTLVFAASAWVELITGVVRRIVIGFALAAAITAALGVGWFAATGVSNRFMPLNQLLAAGVLVILLVTLTIKSLHHKYLLIPERGFLLFATLAFALEALCFNLTRPLFGFRAPILFDHLGFMVLLLAFGYTGLKMVQRNEHRLVEIDAELDVARQIQTSILPTDVPQIRNLQIAATYRPMKSVAGDFYEFLPIDAERAGFFVADVCGHGVPAALIASMLKVAVQSAAANAANPGEFLAALNRQLSEPLRGQLVSAAYLWIDMRARKGLYSAAGHPPLLRWNNRLERIESNGLLFGVLPEAEYPIREVPLCPGDRLLLYTDGITEPENSNGEAFGDVQLEQLLAQSRASATSDISQRIMAEVQTWQHTAEPQDDMTLIVIDVA
jgi:sigma-B regulation protein RsbU (phosphoserine phosphatase)